MSAVYSRLFVHLVWGTWNRQAALDGRKAPCIHSRLARICHNFDSLALAVGGVDDHVHVLVALHQAVSVAKLVQGLKVGTSQFIAHDLRVPDFAWQEGYGVFSLRETECETVAHYIRNQPRHHAEHTTLPDWEQTSVPSAPRNTG